MNESRAPTEDKGTKTIAYQTMHDVLIFLPLLVTLFRLKMQTGCSSRRAISRKRDVPWKLVFREY